MLQRHKTAWVSKGELDDVLGNLDRVRFSDHPSAACFQVLSTGLLAWENNLVVAAHSGSDFIEKGVFVPRDVDGRAKGVLLQFCTFVLSWTIGLDWRSRLVPGLRIGSGYEDVFTTSVIAELCRNDYDEFDHIDLDGRTNVEVRFMKEEKSWLHFAHEGVDMSLTGDDWVEKSGSPNYYAECLFVIQYGVDITTFDPSAMPSRFVIQNPFAIFDTWCRTFGHGRFFGNYRTVMSGKFIEKISDREVEEKLRIDAS
jgi:hypothetical protein